MTNQVLINTLTMFKSYFIAAFVAMFLSGLTFANEGAYIFHNYDVNSGNKSTSAKSLVQNTDNVIFFIQDDEIVAYDGANWHYIITPCIPKALYSTENGSIAAACQSAWGLIVKDQNGQYVFNTIDNKISLSSKLRGVSCYFNSVYYYSKNEIIKYSAKDIAFTKRWKLGEDQQITSIIECEEKTFVTIKNKGFYILQNDGSVSQAGISALATADISHISKLKDGAVVLTTDVNNIYIFDGKSVIKIFDNEDAGVFFSTINDLEQLSSGNIAIATKNQGIVIISKSGEILEKINVKNNLPDNTIDDLMCDRTGALWLSHNYGISKAEIEIPVTDYSVFKGLEGRLINVLSNNDKLYVATTEGVYLLTNIITGGSHQSTSVKRTEEQVTKIVKVTFKSKTDGTPITKEIPIAIGAGSETEILAETSSSEKGEIGFKEITGIASACTHMVAVGNSVVAATNNGLYQIDGTQASAIIENIDVDILQLVNNKLIAAGGESVYILDILDMSVIATQSVALGFAVSIAAENNNIWIGGINSVALISSETDFVDVNTKMYQVASSRPEKVTVAYINEPVIFLGKETILSYNAEEDTIVESGNLNIRCNMRSDFIAKQAGYLWSNGCAGWKNIVSNSYNKTISTYIRIFDDVKDIYIDEKENAWIINNNRIFKIAKDSEESAYNSFSMMISSVMDDDGKLLDLNNIKLNDKNNGIQLSVAEQSYFMENKSQFRYKINGLDNSWSKWTNSGNILIPYLPDGKFDIQVEAKNVFGLGVASASVPVSVALSPFKAWWFYLAIALVVFVVYSIIMSSKVRKLKEENEMLLDSIVELENKD